MGIGERWWTLGQSQWGFHDIKYHQFADMARREKDGVSSP